MRPRLLVLDRDPGLRTAAHEIGEDVRCFDDGREAYQALILDRPDAVIVDSDAAGLDGFAFVRNLRSVPALRSIPVVMIGPLHRSWHSLFARQASVDVLLPEPATADGLREAIDQARASRRRSPPDAAGTDAGTGWGS